MTEFNNEDRERERGHDNEHDTDTETVTLFRSNPNPLHREEEEKEGDTSPLSAAAQEHAETTSSSAWSAVDLRTNFFLFSLLYALVHGAVDAVLAYSAAELGTNLGSWGGFTLYITYTASALLLAKPLLQVFEAKDAVLLGLLGLLLYVAGFFLAVLVPSLRQVFFLGGAAVGGIGAGLLWTAQGAYFTINAKEHARTQSRALLHTQTHTHSHTHSPLDAPQTDSPRSYVQIRKETLVTFAGIFAALYLALETVLKFIATAVFLAQKEAEKERERWKLIVFGIYTGSAALALVLFAVCVRPLLDREETDSDDEDDSSESERERDSREKGAKDTQRRVRHYLHGKTRLFSLFRRKSLFSTNKKSRNSSSSSTSTDSCLCHIKEPTLSLADFCYQALAVARALCTMRKLQLLMPFQLCFGFSAGLVETYVNGVIVSRLLGDGYIGLLSGSVTLTAAALSPLLSLLANRYRYGKDVLIVCGIVCFAVGALLLLCLDDAHLASWSVIVWYYVVHGVARAVWENTNKALIAEYFPQPDVRDAAFASVYFSSGLAGALGFVFFQFLSRSQIAKTNLITAVVALVCFFFAQQMQKQEEINAELLSSVRKLTDSGVGYDLVDERDNESGEDAPFAMKF